MTTDTATTLHAIAIDVVGQYNAAGKHLLGAWRTGAQRLLDGAAARTPAAPLVSDETKARVAAAQQKFNGFLAQRVEQDTALAAKVMDAVADRTTSGIQAVADAAQRVTGEPGVSLLNTLRAVHLPLAQISLKLADTVASGARKIEDRVATVGQSTDAPATAVVKSSRSRAAKAA